MRIVSCILSAYLLTAGLARAAVYDIGDSLNNVVFDSSVDTLTNTGGITNWTDATLDFNDGSDLSGVDFTTLGFMSWTSGKFGGGGSTTWDGANLSGLTLTFNNHNFGYNDSMVGTEFSGATITTTGGNQPFLFVDAEGAVFSGATLNLTPFNGQVNFFRKDGDGDTTTSIRDADFSDTTWGFAIGDAGSLHHMLFNVGPGATNAADRAHAVTFEGADLSLITGLSKTNMISNLGGFDTNEVPHVAIGAKYDQAMLDASGWTAAELDAVGWQSAVSGFILIVR